MRKALWSVVVAGVTVGALAAAEGCSSSSTPGPLYPTPTSFCEALATAECQVTSACGSATTPTACMSKEEQNCLSVTNEIGAGRTYSTDNAVTCVNLAKKIYGETVGANANPLVHATDLANLQDTCERVFAGAVAKNGTCTTSYDCSGTLSCYSGFCETATPLQLTDPCGDPGDTCTSSYCGPNANNLQVCLPLKADGASCTATDQCVTTDHCFNGVCTSLSNGTCASNADCAGDVPYCDPYGPTPYTCDEGEIFSPTATSLCNNFGFGATYPAAPSTDAGTGATDAAPE